MSMSDDFPPVDHNRLRWDTSAKVGEGSFGIVYRGLYDANAVAIKVVKRPQSGISSATGDRLHHSAALKQHRREIDRYQVVRNQFIIQYLGSFRGDDARDLYIVTEFLEGGSLHDSLLLMRENRAALDEWSFLTIASHIARGLLHVHNQQLTHGDMKPQNVLLTSAIQIEQNPTRGCTAHLPANAKAKIADFGLSKRLEGAISPRLFGSTAGTADYGTGPVGTYLYMSPEAYKGIGNLSDDDAKASDIYAYGLVLFELLSGLQSWRLEGVNNLVHLMRLVTEGNRPSWGPRRDHIDPSYIEFVEDCWKQNPEERLKIWEIVDRIDVLVERYKQRLSRPPPIDVQDITTRLGDSSASESSLESRENYLPGGFDRVVDKNSETDSKNEDTKKPKLNSHNENVGMKAMSSNSDTEEQEPDLLDPPAVVHVLSTKLTESEVWKGRKQSPGVGHQYSPGTTSASDDNSDCSDGSITADMGTLDIAKDEVGSESQTDEIDGNLAGIVELKHVKSSRIAKPPVENLQIPDMDVHQMGIMGLGSIANGNMLEDSPPRSNSKMLKSFASPFEPAEFAESKVADEHGRNDYTNFSGNLQSEGDHHTNMEVTKVEMEKNEPNEQDALPFPSLDIGVVLAEPLQPSPVKSLPSSSGTDSSSKGKSPTGQDNGFDSEKRTMNSYSSPDNIEIDTKVLSELEQDDKIAFDESTVTGYHQAVNQNSTGNISTQVASNNQIHAPPSSSTPPSDHSTSQPLQPDYFPAHQSAWNIPSNLDPRIQSGSTYKPIPASMSHPEMRTSYRILPSQQSFHHVQHPTAFGGYVSPAFMGAPTPSAYGSFTAQGASAPPLSDTSQSALGGTSTHQRISPGMQPNSTPSWQTPGTSQPNPSVRLYPPSMSNDMNSVIPTLSPGVSALLYALRRPDGIAVADEMWRHGDRRWVAEALALCRSRGSEKIMSCTARFLAMNNDFPHDRKDPQIAINLCVAIGNFARNEPQALGRHEFFFLLRTVLLVMPNFCHMKEGKTQVFAACCYALSNLFKISNVIADSQARSATAEWIEYAISYNITGDDANIGPFSDSLAYNAACAARNLMWMNEDNVRAFVACSHHADSGRGPPISKLIESMRGFAARGRLFVVESSLSALAMIILYPRQRVQFIHRHGFKVFFETLHCHPCQSSTVSLVFWMITTMFSEPMKSPKESEAFWNAFVIDQGGQELVRSISNVRRGVASEKERVELLEHGFYAILAVMRFNSSMRRSLIDSGCIPHVQTALTDISSNTVVGVQSVDKVMMTHKARLGTVLCDVIKELTTDPSGYGYLRENNVKRSLEELMNLYSSDGTFAHSCRDAIARLSY
eukprot:TRINITY_DN276_c0_g1_i1.p1 TRINITY_DN276_c0_g1~~TRINITY_DN276_c0_g1_i1.p1  ORF type:complete len:1338 (+),score=187.30 TRINITY_DN276_c0_g1_i1:4374-8387(+)